ncbi:hypothetical protein TNCV_1380981 [Trichonephila clavipes]|nr:hypothetical protein TNCV_1380981 [Trichonephila clavipes]
MSVAVTIQITLELQRPMMIDVLQQLQKEEDVSVSSDLSHQLSSATDTTVSRGAMRAKILFIDVNARSHQAHIVNECLQSDDVTHMKWPAFSSDLNSMLHVWDMLR